MIYKNKSTPWQWCRTCPRCKKEIAYCALQTAKYQEQTSKICKECKLGKSTGYIYGLYATDEPLQIRYIGATTSYLEVRLTSHQSQAKSKPHYPVSKWITEVNARNEYIKITSFGEYPFSTLPKSEQLWINFWKQYCNLLNIKKIQSQLFNPKA